MKEKKASLHVVITEEILVRFKMDCVEKRVSISKAIEELLIKVLKKDNKNERE